MSNTIIELRHSYVTGNVPSSLANGEIAINTYDGKLFYRGGPSNTIQTIERFTGPAGLDSEIQFNDSGVLGSASNLTFNKLTGLFRTGNVTANTVTTRDYVQFGDGTRQYTANAGSGVGGNVINVYNANTQVFTGTANGTGTTFVLGFTPASQNSVIVSANGVVQYDYSLSGSTLILNYTPSVGTLIRVQTFGTSSVNSLSALFQTGNLIVYDGNTLVSLSNTNVAGTHGNSTYIPVITTDDYGRIVGVVNTAITGLNASDQYARDTANASFITANSAGSYANAAFIHANAAFDAANSVVDVWVRNQANSAFEAANSASIYANGAFNVANSASVYANGAFAFANSATIYSNGAFIAANTADDKATSAGIYANGAFEIANSAAIAANTPSHVANSASIYANGAFLQANTPSHVANSAAIYANGAFAAANNEAGVNLTQNNSITAAFIRANNSLNANSGGTVTGNVVVVGDFAVTGNLTITGNTTTHDVTSLNISDPLIYLAANNYSSDIVDIGFTGNYYDGSQRHAGLVRHAADGDFYVFYNYTPEPDNNVININDTSFRVATLHANIVSSVATIGGVDIKTYVDNAFNAANAATATDLTQNNSITAAFNLANSASIAANTPSVVANSAFIHANAAFDKANAGGALTVSLTDDSNNFTNVVTSVTGIRFDANSGFDITDLGSGNVKVGMNSTFKTWKITGQSDLIANGLDTIEFVGSNGVVLTSNTLASPKTITFDTSSVFNKANAAFTVANNANTVYVSDSPPSSPVANTLWWQSNTATLKIYYNDGITSQWVDASQTYALDTIARTIANAAFDQANSAYAHANASFITANDAFFFANVGIQDANSAHNAANAAFIRANASFTIANGTIAWNTANAAFLAANSAADTWVRNQANSAFEAANSAGSYANSAFIHANAAFNAANSAADTWVRNQANSAFEAANSAGSYANSAFGVANSASVYANTPSHVANSAAIYANGAFATANNEAGVNATQNTNIQFAWNHANAAFDQANTGGSGVRIDVYNANTNVFTGTANGTGTTFALGFTPNSANSIIVSSNGVVQYDYTLSSSTLIFNFTPPAGAYIRVQSFGSSQANSLNGIFQTGNLIVYDGNTLVSLANTNASGTFGNSTHIPVITTDSYGRITGVVNTTIGISGEDQYARDTANAAFNAANNEAGVNATQNTNISFAWNHANSAFDSANTKTYTYVQDVAPATANVSGALWQNTSSGIVYMNFGNTSNPIWAEL